MPDADWGVQSDAVPVSGPQSFGDNFPEVIKAVVVINAPAVFTAGKGIDNTPLVVADGWQ